MPSQPAVMNHTLYMLSFLLSLIACRQRQEKTQPVVEAVTEYVYASGIVKSKSQYQVFSTVSGLVQKKLVEEGDVVKKGDPLLLLVSEAPRLNVENAKIAA